jgi:serine/threonine protein kinase
MSPEQVQGRDVDARSDLYSLAVVLFELVTGRVPFAEGTDFEIMKAQIEAPPPPLRQLVGDVPPVLENILSRALAKDPAQRYPDASAFRSALDGVLANAAPVGDVAPRAVPETRMITPAERNGHRDKRQRCAAGGSNGNPRRFARTGDLEEIPGRRCAGLRAAGARWSGLVER